MSLIIVAVFSKTFVTFASDQNEEGKAPSPQGTSGIASPKSDVFSLSRIASPMSLESFSSNNSISSDGSAMEPLSSNIDSEAKSPVPDLPALVRTVSAPEQISWCSVEKKPQDRSSSVLEVGSLRGSIDDVLEDLQIDREELKITKKGEKRALALAQKLLAEGLKYLDTSKSPLGRKLIEMAAELGDEESIYFMNTYKKIMGHW